MSIDTDTTIPNHPGSVHSTICQFEHSAPAGLSDSQLGGPPPDAPAGDFALMARRRTGLTHHAGASLGIIASLYEYFLDGSINCKSPFTLCLLFKVASPSLLLQATLKFNL